MLNGNIALYIIIYVMKKYNWILVIFVEVGKSDTFMKTINSHGCIVYHNSKGISFYNMNVFKFKINKKNL